jgi:hypothetical protein
VRPLRRRKRQAPASERDAPPLDVVAQPASYGALVAIAGELDMATVPRVSAALSAEPVAGAPARSWSTSPA